MPKKIIATTTPNLNQSLTPQLLGDIIRARRTQSQLRLEDAASLCGVAKQTFMQIEKGHPTSQLNSILKICNGLGLKLRILPWTQEGEDQHAWN